MGNGLRMSLARNKTSANRLDIMYDAGADLYNMRLYPQDVQQKDLSSARTKDIAVHEGIYFDMLEEMPHDGDGTLHTLLSGGAAESRPTSFR